MAVQEGLTKALRDETRQTVEKGEPRKRFVAVGFKSPTESAQVALYRSLSAPLSARLADAQSNYSTSEVVFPSTSSQVSTPLKLRPASPSSPPTHRD